MNYLQAVLAAATVLATIVLVASTVSFHRWTKCRHSPSPVLVNTDIHLSRSDDKEEALVGFTVTLWNPSVMPVMIEAVRIGLSRLEPAPIRKLLAGPGLVHPGGQAEIPVKLAWPYESLREAREVFMRLSYRTGERTGVLIFRGMRAPSVVMLEDLGVTRSTQQVRELVFHPGPDLAYTPAYSFTYPRTRMGRLLLRVRRWARLMPDDVFDRWRR